MDEGRRGLRGMLRSSQVQFIQALEAEFRCASRTCSVRHCNALHLKRFLNQRENALSPEKPSIPAISFSGR